MKFNPMKCYVVSISQYQDPKFSHIYTLCNTILEHHKDNPYLGVLISQDLSFTNHINNITGKANSTLGFLRRNLKHGPVSLKELAYVSLVRSKLEYASVVWDPYLKKDIDKLEMTQRRGACFVKGNYSPYVSVKSIKWIPAGCFSAAVSPVLHRSAI